MSRRTPASAAILARPTVVLAWAAAAVLAGSVVWWAVAAIGSEQGTTPTVYTQAQVARLADQPRAPGATPTSSGTTSPAVGPSGTPTLVQDPTAAPTSEPTASSAPTPAPIRPTTAPPVAVPPPPVAPAPAPAPAPAAVARTWNVSGGQVAAQCTGSQIVLLSATPQNGWSLEVKHSGPEELEVKFRQGEEETSVHAVCVAGVPEVANEAEHD